MAREAPPVRVLVVEDEWLIAACLIDDLAAAGYEVEGPATSLASAQRILDDSVIDVGLLDVTLRDEKSFPLARSLAAKGVPFAFLTGYNADDLPAEFAATPLIRKPVEPRELLAAVARLSGRGAQSRD